MSLKSCSVKVICLTALLCLSIGPVALFYVCATLIKSYVTTSRYIPTTCQITSTNMTSQNVTCRCDNETGSCADEHACVRVMVRYELPKGGSVERAILYETYDTKRQLSQDNQTMCSYFLCLKTSERQEDSDVTYGYDVIDAGHDVIKSRRNVTCFVDPSDGFHAIRNIPRKEDLFNGLFWPIFGICVGLCFCITAKICTREKD